jgi:uncharacterized protein DUF998
MLKQISLPRHLALAGIVGPWLWALVVVLLTVVEYDTLLAFGWTPGQDNGVNYPSSLALGRVGWLQMINFALLGASTIALAVGLYRVTPPRRLARAGPILLGVAGGGFVLSLFPTDHGPPDAPTTWHGAIHNLAFVVAFVPLLLAFFFLAASFRGDPRWRGYEWLCPAIGLAAIASLVVGGSLLPPSLNQVAFYLTLLVIFVGLTLIGLRLRAVAPAA